MNTISVVQNTEKQIERLRAQRALYSRAKTLLGIHIALSVPFAVVWSILGIFSPQTKIYAAVWGIGVALLDLAFFTPQQKSLKSKAAKIQEAFDCDVLGLNWRSIHVGSRPDSEETLEWSSPRHADPKAKLKDWYPPAVGQLPLPLARVVCQRANCWWDAELRRRYARASMGVVATILAITVMTGIIGHYQVEQWILTGVAPLLPVFMLGLRQSIEQRDAADRLDALRRHAEKMWSDILASASDDKITQESRELQDEIMSRSRIYGVDIPQNSGTIKQVVQIAQSQFGGDIAVAVRSPSVRQLVMLYSEATGQKMPLSATTPYAGSLVEQGGNLYQQASYQDGQAHTYASNIPTLGGIASGTYPTPGGPNTSGGTGATYLSMNVSGSDAANLMTGQFVTPQFVTDQAMAAQYSSYGRTQQSANMQVPGLTVA